MVSSFVLWATSACYHLLQSLIWLHLTNCRHDPSEQWPPSYRPVDYNWPWPALYQWHSCMLPSLLLFLSLPTSTYHLPGSNYQPWSVLLKAQLKEIARSSQLQIFVKYFSLIVKILSHLCIFYNWLIRARLVIFHGSWKFGNSCFRGSSIQSRRKSTLPFSGLSFSVLVIKFERGSTYSNKFLSL